jgi:uncharacterized protein YgfB (UPF0149 family)
MMQAPRPDAQQTPTHAALAAALAGLSLGVQASELHGSLTGYLCAGGKAGDTDWLERLEIAVPDETASSHPLLRALHAAARLQFEAGSQQAEPLLPAADAPLEQRAEALVEWCRGFLGGYGLAGAFASAAPSAVASDVLSDFGTIAGSHFDYDDEAEDARAFADVLEFVREATALLHREARQRTVTLTRALH